MRTILEIPTEQPGRALVWNRVLNSATHPDTGPVGWPLNLSSAPVLQTTTGALYMNQVLFDLMIAFVCWFTHASGYLAVPPRACPHKISYSCTVLLLEGYKYKSH